MAAAKKAWEQGEVAKSLARAPARRTEFVTDSGIPLPTVLTPADRAREDAGDLGLPGQFPYTRGVQPTMYRGRLWTMRMFAGFGSPADTNQRFKYLMAHGTTGLSTAFDMPALMGYDADHSMSRGEVGKEGVAISSLRDFEILFDGIPLDQVTTSMTINASAIVALCMYIAVAEKQGVPMEKLGGTIQNDMLKEYIAQKEWIVPPRPAVRIVVDMIEFCSRHMPRWHPVSISGYHIREAGATAVQELAFTLADGIGYVEECVKRGMEVDDFAAAAVVLLGRPQRLLRGDRQVPRGPPHLGPGDARPLRRQGPALLASCAPTPRPPGVRLTAPAALQQRGPHRAAGPGRRARRHPVAAHQLARRDLRPAHRGVGRPWRSRTQQIIAHESGVDRVVDPLGGSYYVEYLTDEMEKRALEYIRRIDEMGGIIRAVEEGFPQKEIAESAYRYQREVEQGERLIVGVNAFQSDRHEPVRDPARSTSGWPRSRSRGCGR